MQPLISTLCAGCAARVKAPFALLGRKRQCPRCGTPFIVRPEVPEDSGPILAEDPVPAWTRPTRPGRALIQ